MARELIAIRPEIYSGKKNLKAQWYVHYMYKNPWTNTMERFKRYDGINCCKTIAEKTAAALSLQAKLWRKLKAGYNPFDDPNCIYSGSQTNIIFNKESIIDNLKETAPRVTTSNNKDVIVHYNRYIQNFCDWLEKVGKLQYDISLITEDDAEDFLKYLVQEKKHGPKHRNEHLSLLKRIFKYLQRRKVIKENPFEYCKNKKYVSPGKKIYRDEIRLLILEEMEKIPQLLLFCEMLYYTMRRQKELRSLQLKEIHIADCRIEIPPGKSKTGKQGWVTIPRQLLKTLIEMNLRQYPGDFYLFGNAGIPAEKEIGKNYFRKRFLKVKDKLQLGDGFFTYNFKHTGAVKADRANIPHKDIQQQGGWTSMAMLDVYMKDMDTKDSPFIRNKFPDIRSSTTSIASIIKIA
jgi:integrase